MYVLYDSIFNPLCLHFGVTVLLFTESVDITSPPPQPFYGPFSGTTRVSRCRKRTSGLYSAGKISRGRHTDHPAGYHSIRTNQCPPPPSPDFVQVGCPSCCPTNSVKALKASYYIYYVAVTSCTLHQLLHPFNGLFSRTTWVSRH